MNPKEGVDRKQLAELGDVHTPSIAHLFVAAPAREFGFSRSAASRAGRKWRGCARGPTTTAARVLTRLLAGRERRCQPPRGRPAG